MAKSSSVISPNLGLYYGLDPLMVPSRGLQDGRNFRISQAKVTSINLGWEAHSAIDFVDPIMMIETFFLRAGTQKQIIGTTKNIFDYNPEADTATLINPRYDTGTVNSGGNDTFTKFLLHGDGTDTSTTITDSNSGGSAHTWTAAANAQIDTAQFKFGTGAILFDGTGDYVDTPDHADFTLGAGDFTFDAWVRLAAVGTRRQLAGQVNNAGTILSLYTEVTAGNLLSAVLQTSGGNKTVTGSTVLAVNTWYHFAVARSGINLYLFVNGVLEASIATLSTEAVTDSADNWRVGSAGIAEGTIAFWNGWIEEARLSVGVARWTAAFTPPTATYSGGSTVIQLAGGNFTTGGVEAGDMIHFGAAAYTTWPGTWFEIDSVDGATQLTLTSSPGQVTGSAYTIRKVFTGGITDFFDSATFVAPDDGLGGVDPDLFFVTNGVDFVHTWDGSSTQMVEQSTMNFKCKQLFVFKNMMIYGNLVYQGETLPTSIINSDIGKPLNAGDSGTGLSEQFRVNDGFDGIDEMEDMGDNLVFYSLRHVTLCQFVGDPLIFIFREAGEGVGPISGRLIADFGDYHEFIGADSQYLFDGVTISTINQQVWREVLRQRDASRQHFGWHHFDEERGDLIWAIPLTSDAGVGDEEAPPEEAFVEHYLEEVGDKTPTPFSRRAMPFICAGYGTVQSALTWDEITETWDQMVIRWNDSQLFAAFPLNLTGGATGTLYKINTIQTGAGVDLVSYIRFGRRAVSDSRQRGLLKRIYPFAEKLDRTLDVTVRMMDHASGPATITDTQEFDTTLPEAMHFTTHYRRGRFFEPQFGADGDPWTLSGYDVDTMQGGRR